MKKYLNQKKQKGQAIVETAIVLPLLVILLLGVGYFGSVITMQHNLTVAARYAARAVAVESTRNPRDRVKGTFLARVKPEMFKNYAMRVLPGFKENRLSVHPVDAAKLMPFDDYSKTSSFTPVNKQKIDYTFVYQIAGEAHAFSNNINPVGNNSVPELRNMKVGMGAVFFGVRLTYRLTELDWMARLLFRKKEGVTIEAISLMPAELPLRSWNTPVNVGLMDMNEGLFNIVRTDPNDPNAKSYVDLIPKNR